MNTFKKYISFFTVLQVLIGLNGFSQISFFTPPVTNYSAHDKVSGLGGVLPRAVVAADFDNDGDADLATANSTSNSVTVLRNSCGAFNMTPTVTFTVSLSPATAPIAIATGDLDLDGDLDIVTANNTGAANNISVLRNNFIGLGNFTFTLVGNITVGATPTLRGITVAKFDAGAEWDIAVTSTASTNVYILMGNAGAGDLTFGAATAYTALSCGAGITASDLDSDSDQDIITIHRNSCGANAVSVFTNDGTGVFSTYLRIDYTGLGTTDPIFVTTALLNADTKPDLIVGYGTAASMRVILNTTTVADAVTFNTPGTTYATGTGAPVCVAPADYDLDGFIDLISANFSSTTNISIYRGDGTGSFSANSTAGYALGTSSPRWIVAADFNLDGKTDAAIANEGNNNVTVLLNQKIYSGSLPSAFSKAVTANTSQFYDVKQTVDGGFILSGKTYGFGSCNTLQPCLVKTTTDGSFEWARTYGKICSGGDNNEGASVYEKQAAYSVQQTTNDGGYVMAGSATPAGSSGRDVLVVKTNACGDTIWSGLYGGVGTDYGRYVIQTTDGGYVVVGETNAVGPGNIDLLLFKLDANGTIVWSYSLGTGPNESGYYVQECANGDLIASGYTNSGTGGKDVFVVRTNSSGSILWSKAYGGAGNDEEGYAVIQTDDDNDGQQDDGFIVAGYTKTYSTDSRQDQFILKLTADGSTVSWCKDIGKNGGDDMARSIIQIDDADANTVKDNGYILVGEVPSEYSLVTDFGLTKINSSGAYQWARYCGGANSNDPIPYSTANANYDAGYRVIQTSDNGLMMAGMSQETPTVGSDHAFFRKTDVTATAYYDACGFGSVTAVNNSSPSPTITSPVGSSNTPFAFTKIGSTGIAILYTYSRTPSVIPVCNDILPVVLVSFTADCDPAKKEIVLKWATASETNNDYFTVEKSTDGTSFELIGTLNGAGNSSSIRKYEFIDQESLSPSGERPGVRFYRLKQTDYDGRSEYFGPVSTECSGEGISIYPSIGTGTFVLENTGPTIDILRIYNGLGSLIAEQHNVAKGVHKIQIEAENGIYYTRIQAGQTVLTKKIIIER